MSDEQGLTQATVDGMIVAILERLDRNGYREAVLAEVDPAALPGVLAAEDRGYRAMEQRGYGLTTRRSRRRT